MSDWINTVKKVYSENKSKPGYSYKQAMKDAKKMYKSTETTSNKIVGDIVNPVLKMTKSKRSKKSSKSRKSRKTRKSKK
jgi:hypothetical protein